MPSFSNTRGEQIAGRAFRFDAMDCAWKRLLQRFGRADVWLGSARADRNAEAHSGNARLSGCELRTRRGILHHIDRNDRKVEGAAGRRHLDQLRRGAEANDELMAGGALELRSELPQRAAMPAPARTWSSVACTAAPQDSASARHRTPNFATNDIVASLVRRVMASAGDMMPEFARSYEESACRAACLGLRDDDHSVHPIVPSPQKLSQRKTKRPARSGVNVSSTVLPGRDRRARRIRNRNPCGKSALFSTSVTARPLRTRISAALNSNFAAPSAMRSGTAAAAR